MNERARLARLRVLARRHGPTAPIWRRRAAILSGAVLLGLAALAFARAADWGTYQFLRLYALAWWAPLGLTPAGFAALVWLTRRLAPDARGSGIPQIMAARLDPEGALVSLASARTALVKFASTVAALMLGASVGREGPTVQISATIMAYAHRALRVPVRASVMVAGGAAGVAAAFNTPLAGVTFAIEELAAAYEQRMTLLVMTAVLISGMTSLGIAGDYVYFGAMTQTLPLARAAVAIPLAGVAGGIAGGLFSRLLIGFATGGGPFAAVRRRPVLTAAVAGLVVALLGCATGLSWGTGYEPARRIITGADAPVWFGPAKFLATLATAVSGLPGGIFAPSLATGAGLGELLRTLIPDPALAGPVVLLGMTGYFTGVVRAPLTAVVIISETTASRGLLLPLLATALIADAVSALVCRERLYHGLSAPFVARIVPPDARDAGH